MQGAQNISLQSNNQTAGDMEYVDRQRELARVQNALNRENPQLIVIYGRRRIGKSKWQEHIDAAEEPARLETIVKGLPFAQGHNIHYGLFLKEPPSHPDAVAIYSPEDVLMC